MIICNVILAVCVLVLLARLGYMQMQHQEVISSIVKLNEDTLKIPEECHKAIVELNNTLNHILQNQNTFYGFAGQRLDFNVIATQWLLAGLRPYIFAVQQEAIKNDNYEEAEQCQRLIKSITELIEHKFK